jgi:hypothetical protein
MAVLKIISGGQTGADRGGLEAAIALSIPHGGWCPKGRLAEDGTVPGKYALSETCSADYAVRTERNVADSDGTVLFTRGEPSGGSALTASLARRAGRPLLHVDLKGVAGPAAAERVRAWLAGREIRILNVAGSRESEAPGIAAEVREILENALR